MFMARNLNRRDLLKTLPAAALMVHTFGREGTAADDTSSPNARPRAACIGVGGRGATIARHVARHADVVAICDVDRDHAEHANKAIAAGRATVYSDYRRLLDRERFDVVTIGTPDHWHTKICIDAMTAGKDVYCEKPLTLTVDEGKLLCRAVQQTKRILQVGTQQRSEYDEKFLKAVALVQSGRLGRIRRVTCVIGGGPRGQAFRTATPPAGLDWDLWLGQAPRVDYIPQRCHASFRWWYEYSGGKMTDWGAHHVDIAQWAIGMDQSGPTSIEVQAAELPVEFRAGMPTVSNTYNTALTFRVRCEFANGVELILRDHARDLGIDNGIRFEGEKGNFFVSRNALRGEPVDELARNPLADSVFTALRKGKPSDSHMGNFIACVRDRGQPVSDVVSHHRALSTCHLANIAIRLRRNLRWNPAQERFTGDDEANTFLAREQRRGFEIQL
jgi:predicted dehydrogenase